MGLFSNYFKSTIDTEFYTEVGINLCDKSVTLDQLQLKTSGFLRTIVLHVMLKINREAFIYESC